MESITLLITIIGTIATALFSGLDVFVDPLTHSLAAITDGLSSAFVLAQTTLETGVGNILKLLRIVAFMLAVGALIISGIAFGQGRTEAAIYGVIAAGILALSGAITSWAFSQTDSDPDLDFN